MKSELAKEFGSGHSLASRLRFPLFVQSITAQENAATIAATSGLRAARTVLAEFDANLDDTIRADQRYDFRFRLIPMIGPRTEADAAFEFVNTNDLTPEQLKIMTESGRTGNVITQVKTVPVSAAGYMLPGRVVSEVQKRLPFDFNVNKHTCLWKYFQVRPGEWSGAPAA